MVFSTTPLLYHGRNQRIADKDFSVFFVFMDFTVLLIVLALLRGRLLAFRCRRDHPWYMLQGVAINCFFVPILRSAHASGAHDASVNCVSDHSRALS
jgi:hypothetical protein